MKMDVNLDKLFDLEPQQPVAGQPMVSLLPAEQTTEEETWQLRCRLTRRRIALSKASR